MANVLIREGVESDLVSENPILNSGEICIVLDKGNSKIGDGVSTFTSLLYQQTTGGGSINYGLLNNSIIQTGGSF